MIAILAPLLGVAGRVARSPGGIAIIAFASAWMIQGARLEMANHALRERAKEAVAAAQEAERAHKNRADQAVRQVAEYIQTIEDERRIAQEHESRLRMFQRQLAAARGEIETQSRRLAEELVRANDACKEVLVPDVLSARFRELHQSVYRGIDDRPLVLHPSDVPDPGADVQPGEPAGPRTEP